MLDITCLPTDVQRRIFRFLSHPTADLIKRHAKHLHVLYICDSDQLPFAEFRDDFHRFYFAERLFFHAEEVLWRACGFLMNYSARYKFVRKNTGLKIYDTDSDFDSDGSDGDVRDGIAHDGAHPMQ